MQWIFQGIRSRAGGLVVCWVVLSLTPWTATTSLAQTLTINPSHCSGSAHHPKDGKTLDARAVAVDAFCGAYRIKNYSPNGTVSVMGSARTGDGTIEYELARQFAATWGRLTIASGNPLTVLTGGGPGVMEAANRGASESGLKTLGFSTPFNSSKGVEKPNPYVPLSQAFSYASFAQREADLLDRAQALVVAPGGMGTEWEAYEALAKIQQGWLPPIPIIFLGGAWETLARRLSFLDQQGLLNPPGLRSLSFTFKNENFSAVAGPQDETRFGVSGTQLEFFQSGEDAAKFLHKTLCERKARGAIPAIEFPESVAQGGEEMITLSTQGCQSPTLFTRSKIRPPLPTELAFDVYCAQILDDADGIPGNYLAVYAGSEKSDSATQELVRSFSKSWAKTFGSRWPILTTGTTGPLAGVVAGAKEGGARATGFLAPSKNHPPPTTDLQAAHVFLSLSQRESEVIERSAGFVFAAGGLSVEWAVYNTLTRMQTGKMSERPVVLLGDPGFWKTFQDRLHDMVKRGTIKAIDLQLFQLASTPAEAIEILRRRLEKV